jgi:hypothetical protein
LARIDADIDEKVVVRHLFRIAVGKSGMIGMLTKTLFAMVLSAMSANAFAEAAKPAPWVLSPEMAYGYDKDGKTLSYKLGTNNAGLLLKGAKKVPRGTLFFIGQNGQLYMRPGPFLEGDGKFLFGSD